MFRLLVSLCLLNISTFVLASPSVSQSVMFSGFPGETTYQNTYSVNYGGAVTNITALPPQFFPPSDPITYNDQQYSVTCNNTDDAYCYAYFTSNINYNNKSCTVKITLKIDLKYCQSPPFSCDTEYSQTNSVSGNCTITGSSGDKLWIVTPR